MPTVIKPYYSVYVFASKHSLNIIHLPYSLWVACVPCQWILGILSDDDGDGNENGKKAFGLGLEGSMHKLQSKGR